MLFGNRKKRKNQEDPFSSVLSQLKKWKKNKKAFVKLKFKNLGIPKA